MRALAAIAAPFRALYRAIADFEMYPVCPICGKVVYCKAMPLHLEGHARFDEELVEAWRQRGAPRKWDGG